MTLLKVDELYSIISWPYTILPVYNNNLTVIEIEELSQVEVFF